MDQVLVDFVAEFSLRVVNLELGYPTSTQNKEGSLEETLALIEPAPDGPKVRRESPQDIEEPTAENINMGHEVCKAATWKMFVNRARNNLEAGVGVVLKSLEGAVF